MISYLVTFDMNISVYEPSRARGIIIIPQK